MAGAGSAYRLTDSVMAVVCKETRKKLERLNAGSILIPTSPVDSAGMIKATCQGLTVFIFRRDIEERSIEITQEGSASVAKTGPQSNRVSPPLEWQLAKRNE